MNEHTFTSHILHSLIYLTTSTQDLVLILSAT